MALTRAGIVDAALRILDAYGLGDLSMRRVADDLGVQAGALYYHVPNKQSLLAALADAILADLGDDPPTGDLAAQLGSWAASLRAALLAHRDAAELVASVHAMGLGDVDVCRAGREAIASAGHPNADASATALLHFVLGHVMGEQTRAQLHGLGVVESHDPAASQVDFTWGVALLASGIKEGPDSRIHP